ncbi:MAG: hypothetical protein AAGD11_08350 [Planctomycetota bacterium]
MRKFVALMMFSGVAVLAAPTQATILDDFNSGTIVTDFLFDDALDTQIPDAVNSAAGGLSFDSDSDNDNVVTNGSGELDASGKDNTAFGSNYVDIPGINGGRVIGLFDVAWAFDESVYDSGQDEEFRLTLVTNDPRSTFVTGEIFFKRISTTEVELVGNAVGTGSDDTPEVILGSSGSLLTLLDVNLDADTLELFYSTDDGASFTSAGTGVLDPSRGVESVRLVINEDYVDDSLLIDRFAVSHIVPEPTAFGMMTSLLIVIAARRQCQ